MVANFKITPPSEKNEFGQPLCRSRKILNQNLQKKKKCNRNLFLERFLRSRQAWPGFCGPIPGLAWPGVGTAQSLAWPGLGARIVTPGTPGQGLALARDKN